MQQFLDNILNGPARYALSHHFSETGTLLFVLGALAAEIANKTLKTKEILGR